MADLATPRSPKFVARDSLNTARRAASSAKRAKCCSWVRQLPIYNLKAAILLSESSALLSFHTTSYSKYLQKFAFKFRSFGLPTEGPRKNMQASHRFLNLTISAARHQSQATRVIRKYQSMPVLPQIKLGKLWSLACQLDTVCHTGDEWVLLAILPRKHSSNSSAGCD